MGVHPQPLIWPMEGVILTTGRGSAISRGVLPQEHSRVRETKASVTDAPKINEEHTRSDLPPWDQRVVDSSR